MRFNGQNKKFINPRYFLREQEEEQKGPVAQVQIGAAKAFSPDTGDPSESIGGFKPGTDQPSLNGAGAVVERARSVLGKGWTYSLTGCPECRGNEKDPKPDPKSVPMGSSGATCDCSGYVTWAYGFGQKSLPGNGKLGDYLKNEVLHPQPGDIIARGRLPTTNYPHFGIVTGVNPPNATDKMINDGEADVSVIHCSSKNGPIEVQNAIKGGWAGAFKERVPVAFFRPQELMNNKFLSAGSEPQQNQQIVSPQQVAKENKMRVEKWDILMHRLLTEKKEKELKASKSKGSKPDFLDLDDDGDTSEPMKKASKESGGKKETKPKKGKGKIPPQLKMHIKKKKNKLDEAIERLEKVLLKEDLFNDLPRFIETEFIDNYENQMVATIRFTTDIRGDRNPINIEAREKMRSGEFKESDYYPYSGIPEFQYYVHVVMELAKKLDPEAEVFQDGYTPSIAYKTEDKQSFIEFLDAVQENADRIDQLTGYDTITVYGGKIKERNTKEPMTPWMRNKYRIKNELDLLKDNLVDTDDEISAPGAIIGGQIQEMIRRIEKILLEELSDSMLDEYGGDRHPPIEDTDDDDWDDFDEFEGETFECPHCGASEEEGYHDGKCEKCGEGYEEKYDEDYDNEDWGDDDYEEDLEEGVEYLSEAEVKKKQPRLGKVTRNPSGSKKKFHVYVKCGGKVKKISFGDPGLSIKRDSAARRKNFRARHKCDKPAGKDRCTARYWSCYQWRAGKKVEGE